MARRKKTTTPNDTTPTETERDQELDALLAEEDALAEEVAAAGLPEAAAPAPRTPKQSQLALQRKVRMFYDLQRLRIQAGGRTLAHAPESEIQLHDDDMAVLKRRAAELHTLERGALRDVRDHLEMLPAYRALFLDSEKGRWKGCGVTLAGVLFSSIDIHRAQTVSAVWKLSGLHVTPAQRCKRCSSVLAERRFDVEGADIEDGSSEGIAFGYEHPKGKCPLAGSMVAEADRFSSGEKPHRTKGEKSPYNGWLRAKMTGVLGPSLLKSASPFRKYYDDYKHRKQSQGWGKSDGHRHAAAVRYMVKMFLAEFWEAWRRHEGLEVRPRYQEQYLGHTHHTAPASARTEASAAI
jgi:hypothetical protein